MLQRALSSPPFIVEAVVSAKECLQFAQLGQYEAVLVDTDALDFGDVLALMKLLRQERPDQSLFVFARCFDLDQRLRLFDAGVDDCVKPEPFFESEFCVRLRLSIRLRQAASNVPAASSANILRSGDLELDLVRRKVTRHGKEIDLRSKEFMLMNT
jgi:DNA-binding response OmpR family regulator